MRRPKKSQLMPIVIGAALVGAYLLFGGTASADTTPPSPGPGPTPPTPQPPQPVPPSQDHVSQTSGGLMTTGQAQKMLKSLGPAAGDSALSSLVIDGVWGPKTSTAVSHFQQIKGIAVTGQVDPGTGSTLANTYNAFIAQGGVPAV